MENRKIELTTDRLKEIMESDDWAQIKDPMTAMFPAAVAELQQEIDDEDYPIGDLYVRKSVGGNNTSLLLLMPTIMNGGVIEVRLYNMTAHNHWSKSITVRSDRKSLTKKEFSHLVKGNATLRTIKWLAEFHKHSDEISINNGVHSFVITP